MNFIIEDKVVKYPGAGGWYFVEVSNNDSVALKQLSEFDVPKVGFGYIKVRAKIGQTAWKTTLFPQKDGPYLVAIKASVRRAEKIEEGDKVRVSCEVELL